MPGNTTDKVALRVGEITCDLYGEPGEYIYDLVRKTGEFYEATLLRTLHAVYQGTPRDLIVDVGANIGNHTVYFAKYIGAPVLAIEPIEENIALLETNIEANGLLDSVEVHAVAAWNRNEDLRLEQNIENNSGTFQVTSSGKRLATGKRIDELVNDRPVSLIKIDVEGSEDEVLEGAIETIRGNRPVLVIEAHSEKAIQRHREFLEPFGYEVVGIFGRSDNYIWWPSGEEARRVRGEIEVVSQRAVQRNFTTSINRHGELLKSLHSDVKAIDSVLSSLRGALEELKRHRPEGLITHDDKSDTRLGKTQSNGFDSSNVSAQLTQMALELGKTSAGVSQAVEQVNKVNADESSRGELIAKLVNEQKSVAEQLRELKDLVDSDSQTFLRIEAMLKDIQDSRVGSVVRQKMSSHASTLTWTAREIQHKLTTLEHRLRDENGDISEAAQAGIDELYSKVRPLQRLASDIGSDLEAVESATNSEEDVIARLAGERDQAIRAYQRLSQRFERYNPNGWTDHVTHRVLNRMSSHDLAEASDLQSSAFQSNSPVSPTYLPRLPRRRRQRVRVGIASMPGRENTLARVLFRIAPQVDEVFVYLNNFDVVPSACASVPDNVQFFTGPDLGDRGKFSFLEGFEGYYLTVDDDIDYAKYHVVSLIKGIEKYHRRAIVGWHGSIFKEPFENFYDPASRDVYSFRNTVKYDTPVHLLGTGTTGFHTDTIQLSLSDFKAPNMADAFLASAAKKQGVGMIVLSHLRGQAVPLETPGSISDASLGKKNHNKAQLDVRSKVTKLIQDNRPWPNLDKPKNSSASLRVAIVGRTNPQRWKKGGIFKSCRLTREMLLPYDCEVHLADIMDGDPVGLEGFDADIVMVYVGDPERPDYKNVHRIVEHHADRGIPVLVNLSEDSHPQRTTVIAQVMENWQQRYGGLVKMMAFTPEVQNVELYRNFSHNIVSIPKTLAFTHEESAEFDTSSGIFIGDVAKLSDSRLVGSFVQDYIDELRLAVPEARIYGVRQYKPRFEIPHGIDEIWPHLPSDELTRRLAKRRLAVNLVKYATYEMVPVEAAAAGVPVLYPNMHQSLNSALGFAGLQYSSPQDLAQTAQLLYRDPVLWRQYSLAGRRMTHAQDFDVASAQMYTALKKIVASNHSIIGAN